MDRVSRLNGKPIFQTGVPGLSLRPSQPRPTSQPTSGQCDQVHTQCQDSSPTVGAPSLPVSDPPSGQTTATASSGLGPRRCPPVLQTPPQVFQLEPGSPHLLCGCLAPRAVWQGVLLDYSSYRLDARDFNAFLEIIIKMLSLY